MFPLDELPLHTPVRAMVTIEFVCQRRNGSHVVVPPGPCLVEQGEHFAAISWAQPNGNNRAEVSLSDFEQFVLRGRLDMMSSPA